MRRNQNPTPNHRDSSASSGQGSGFAGNARTDPRRHAIFRGSPPPPHPPVSELPQDNTSFYLLHSHQHTSPQQMALMSRPVILGGTGPLFMPVAATHPTGSGHRDHQPEPLGPSLQQGAVNLQTPLEHHFYQHLPSSSGNASHNTTMSETDRRLGDTAKILTQPHLVPPNTNMLRNSADTLSMYPSQQERLGQGVDQSPVLFGPPHYSSQSSYPNGNQGTGGRAVLYNYATDLQFQMASVGQATPPPQQLGPRPSQQSPTHVAESSNSNIQPPLMVCKKCGAEFSGQHRRRNWSRHQEKHEGGPISCQDCDSTFNRSDALLKHQRQKHPERGIAGPVPRLRTQGASEVAGGVSGKATNSSSPTGGVVNDNGGNALNGNAVGNSSVGYSDLNSADEGFFPRFDDALSMGYYSRS